MDMKIKLIKLLIFILIISVCNVSMLQADKASWTVEYNKAARLYETGKYDEAIILFREIMLSSSNQTLMRESYFWIGKAYMGIGKLKQAEVNLEHYISKYKKSGTNYPEAIYQKGRLLFLQEQYQSSIKQLDIFIQEYPKHSLVSNAYYWIGECLYALGQFDDSAWYFTMVIEKFPKAVKTEASLFKLRLIEHKKSELALQNLLKWSQEQYLSTLNQFKVKEKSLRQAIEEYEKGRVSALSEQELEEYKSLKNENELLREKIEDMQRQMDEMSKGITDSTIQDQLQQIALKEELLKQKEEVLKILELELRKKEEALGR
jgi:TolA-binding protein